MRTEQETSEVKNSSRCKAMVGGEAMAINCSETEEKFCKYLSGKYQPEDALSTKVWFSTHPGLTPPPKKGGRSVYLHGSANGR